MDYDFKETGFLIHNVVNGNLASDYDKKYCGDFLRNIGKRDINFIKHILRSNNIKEGANILDLGCGRGRFASVFLKYNYTGIDFSENAIKTAQRKYPNCNFICCLADKIPIRNDYFDFIFSFGSLEHFPSMGKALDEVYRLLKPSGIAFFELPNLFFLGYYLRYFFLKKTPWSGQLFERLGGIDSYSNLFKKHKFVIKEYFGRNYKSWKCFNPLFQLIWNLGDYFLPAHIKENHCFLLKKPGD